MTKTPSLPLWLALAATPLLGCAATGRAAAGAPGPVDSPPPPPLWQSAEHLDGACAAALSEAKRLRDALVGAPQPRPAAATLERYDKLLATLDTTGGWASLLFNVHPEVAVRDAAKRCQQELSRFETSILLDRGVYDVIAAVDTASLDAETQRFVSHVLRDFRRAGVDRDEATRTRLAAIADALTKLTQDFRQNITRDVREVRIDAGPDALAGLPEDFVAAHAPGPDGKIVLTTDYPDFIPVQRYARDEALRRELYTVYLARARDENPALLERVLALRAEKAKLLGFPHWAEYNAADKMVRDAATIDRFIEDVARIARPRMEADLAELLAFKRREQPKAQRVEAWDRFYATAKVREERYAFDSRAVRTYFPYTQVKEGILALYAELFGLTFERLETAPVWHPSVEAWSMSDGGEVIGVFYLDMHPRDGKYKHAAMFSPQTGVAGGALPIGMLLCNFPDPSTGDGHALMEHSQVLTFLHEFGHLIHHQLARGSRWVRLAGINVEWDFVEAPSQLLEEWGWDPKVLARFARHVDTGAPIPAELVARMRAADEFGKGAEVMRQIFYAAFSFHLHARTPEGLELEAFTDRINKAYSPYPRVPETAIYANFGHLMGYSSMYYTYQWSLTIAKDLFTRFSAAGLLDQKVARQYRDSVLGPGGSRDAAALVTDFLGRAPNLEAYRGWLQSPPGAADQAPPAPK